MIAIFYAMEGEIGELPKDFRVKSAKKHGKFFIVEGKYRKQNLILVRTGVGKKMAQSAAKFVFGQHQKPEKVLITGFGGGLKEELKNGDIIVCNSIWAEGKPPISSDSKLKKLTVEVLINRKVNFCAGRNLTLLKFAQDSAEKKGIARQHPSVSIIEMEDYWIASIAAKNKIPFLAVRQVYDALNERIPSPEERSKKNQERMEVRFRDAANALRNNFLIPFLEKLSS